MQPHQVIDGGPAPDGMQIHTAPKAIAKRKKIRAPSRRGSVELIKNWEYRASQVVSQLRWSKISDQNIYNTRLSRRTRGYSIRAPFRGGGSDPSRISLPLPPPSFPFYRRCTA